MKDIRSTITLEMWHAFLLGAQYGQAQLEQHMDNNFFDAAVQVAGARKTGGTHHQVARSFFRH